MHTNSKTKHHGTNINLERSDAHADRHDAYLLGSNISGSTTYNSGYPLFSARWPQKALAGIVLLLVLASCHKQDAPKSTQRIQQEQLVRDLGLNGKVGIPEGIPSPATSLNFKTLEEAKAYFRLQETTPISAANHPVTSGTVSSLLHKSNIELVGAVVIINMQPVTPINPFTMPPNDHEGGPGDGAGSVSMGVWGSLNGYNVYFNYNIAGGVISASDFATIFSGVTLGQNYSQVKSNSWVYPNSTNIYFEIKGEKKYSVFVGGIGTYMTRVVTIKGRYNTKTQEKEGIAYEEAHE